MWLISEFKICKDCCAGQEGTYINRNYLKMMPTIENLYSEIENILTKYNIDMRTLDISAIVKNKSVVVKTCGDECETYLWIDKLDNETGMCNLNCLYLNGRYEDK